MTFTVITFNLRLNTPRDGANAWPARADRAARALRDAGALLAGTQEGQYGMLLDLGTALPEYRWFGQGRRGGLGDEFCAIWYRHDRLELLESGDFALSERPEVLGSQDWGSDCPRICTWGLLRLHDAGSCPFLFFNTHLDHISREAREKGALLVWRHLQQERRRTGAPAILTGDFNDIPGSLPIRFLRGQAELEGERTDLQDAYLAAEARPGATYHGFTGRTEGEPIDYILATPEVAVLDVQVLTGPVDGGFPSDHFPVTARLHL
jgi:endonuclease/exonuclease/phosphatase family metal-dependent hydrolase